MRRSAALLPADGFRPLLPGGLQIWPTSATLDGGSTPLLHDPDEREPATTRSSPRGLQSRSRRIGKAAGSPRLWCPSSAIPIYTTRQQGGNDG